MRYWLVGDFFDNTTRLIGGLNNFGCRSAAEIRKAVVLSWQTKPHHVEYRVATFASLYEASEAGVLTMGYP